MHRPIGDDVMSSGSQCPYCGDKAVTVSDPNKYTVNWKCRKTECIQKRKEHMKMMFLPTIHQQEFNYGIQ